jgi:hypothetical protein
MQEAGRCKCILLLDVRLVKNKISCSRCPSQAPEVNSGKVEAGSFREAVVDYGKKDMDCNFYVFDYEHEYDGLVTC